MRSLQSTLFALFAASCPVQANALLNLTSGVTPVSHDLYELYHFILAAFSIGFLLLVIIIYKYYLKKASYITTLPSYLIKAVLIAIPILVVGIISVPAFRVWQNMYDDTNEDITIEITAYQCHWYNKYTGKSINLPGTQEMPIVVPIRKKIRFLITSQEGSYVWWVPEIGIKRKASVGRINKAWARIDKPGLYLGRLDVCGTKRELMLIAISAVSEAEYKRWLVLPKQQVADAVKAAVVVSHEDKKLTPVEELKQAIARGEKIYARTCSVCHQPTGTGIPPTFPALKGSKMITGPVVDHIDRVVNGKPGTAMQAFRNLLNEQEIADVVAYERNAWGNEEGRLVKSEAVKAVKERK